MRPHRRFVVPAVLASTLVGAGACPSPSDDDASDDASAASEGEGPDCKIADEVECEEHPACMWGPEVEFCVVDCSQLVDAQSCEMAMFCEWIDAICEHHVS